MVNLASIDRLDSRKNVFASCVSRFSLAAPATYSCLAQLPTACVSGLSLAPRQPAAAATVVFTAILFGVHAAGIILHIFGALELVQKALDQKALDTNAFGVMLL